MRPRRSYFGDLYTDEQDGECRGDTVHEPEEPHATGVLDSRGAMIYRQPERIGFRLHRK